MGKLCAYPTILKITLDKINVLNTAINVLLLLLLLLLIVVRVNLDKLDLCCKSVC